MSKKADILADAVRAAFYVKNMGELLNDYPDSYVVVAVMKKNNINIFFDVERAEDESVKMLKISTVRMVHHGASYKERDAAEGLLEVVKRTAEKNPMLSSIADLKVMTVAEAIAIEMDHASEAIKVMLLELADADRLQDVVRSKLVGTGRMIA